MSMLKVLQKSCATDGRTDRQTDRFLFWGSFAHFGITTEVHYLPYLHTLQMMMNSSDDDAIAKGLHPDFPLSAKMHV